jgi:hypothetical protein
MTTSPAGALHRCLLRAHLTSRPHTPPFGGNQRVAALRIPTARRIYIATPETPPPLARQGARQGVHNHHGRRHLHRLLGGGGWVLVGGAASGCALGWATAAARADAAGLTLPPGARHSGSSTLLLAPAAPAGQGGGAAADCEPFEHPYNLEARYWRLLRTAGRALFLVVTFLPFGLAVGVAWATGSEAMRRLCLGILVPTIEHAGCCFQKLGQWCSMRPDIYPPDVIATLR